MKIKGNTIIFSTGKEIYAYSAVIGLSPDLQVKEGFDGDIDKFEVDSFDPNTTKISTREFTDGLIRKERIELANYMIKQWEKYKNKAAKY